MNRIYLSSPHMGEQEFAFVREAFATNWIAPIGPHVNAFEAEFCQAVGTSNAAAVSSGTSALHLALILGGVERGDEVVCSTLTFVASANPILQVGAIPVFVDSDEASWNMDPGLLREVLSRKAARGKLPKAVVLVHLYGQSADIDPILDACEEFGVTLIEDAAEALGATYWSSRKTRPVGTHKGDPMDPGVDVLVSNCPEGKTAVTPGTMGRFGIYSFNGNKIITTSGGGMLVTDEAALADRARFLATQARDPAPHYEHSCAGFNYRMSNVLAGIGRGQLRVLSDRVEARRRVFDHYVKELGDLPGLTFMPEADFGRSTRWLTCLTIDPGKSGGITREHVRLQLEQDDVEARPVWKPMHQQPLFAGAEIEGGAVADRLFELGLCLPSGSNLTTEDLTRVVDLVRRVWIEGKATQA